MEEIKLELAPKLTEEPETAGAQTALQPAPATRQPSDGLVFSELSTTEQKMVTDFVAQIDVTDTNQVMQYGASAQNKIAQFSDSVLSGVRNKDLGEAGKLLSDLVVEIKSYDATAEDKGLMGLFNNAKKSVASMAAKYSKVEVSVDKIVSGLESHQRTLLKDIAVFDKLYENNLAYYKEISMYIIAGRQKLAELREKIIPELRVRAESTNDQMDSQKLNDMVNFAERFEKKIHDLILSRTISQQMGPQIRLLQNNDAVLTDKIQSSIVNAIPLWKNQMVIALGLANSQAALQTQRKVTDMTNELLRKNSEMLKQGTLDVARESERGIVSVETLQKTNRDLIDTINGVIDIQRQGSEKRAEAEREIMKIEDELKSALLGNVKRQ
ncbi:MAG: toxic anion resistance protein [Clostridiales bacterium]|jgi:uncharacterized protein YaaN involved in tellurite resistance|nr:toxic anion resistance protein [Clostridiales bacterium]